MSVLHHAKALLLSQAGQRAVDEHHTKPRESGAVDAGLRRASLSPHSTTLRARVGRWSFLPRSLAPYCIVTAYRLNHPFTFVKKPCFGAVLPRASGSASVTGTVTGRL